jgi:hypothetical protein
LLEDVQMFVRGLLAGALAILVMTGAAGDSIIVDGVMHDNVVVREGPSQYYVQIPSDGRTISAPKSDVKPSDVVILKDKAAREALLQEWTENNALRPKPKSAAQKQEKKAPKRPLVPLGISSDPEIMTVPSYGPEPTGVVQRVRSAAGGATVETGTFVNEKGVKRLVLKGNRQKEEGFETRVEQERALERAMLEEAPPQGDFAETPPPESGGDMEYAPEP